ncbi:hypothetical protein SLS60_007024 [Paraconiothyrium brasiliense]|uniref:Uncharacterized protein n=1 Tax=Paraconiothyrium brasiliense TaxID=300254 RepID=A0ABR3R8H5_9PLEO
MRFLITLLFAFVATAAAFPEFHFLEARKDGNGTKSGGGKKNGTSNGNSVNKQCKQMMKMVKLTELAANQTKLDALVSKGKLNETEIQVIKDKAANATTTLKTLQANTTLVDECNVIAANNQVKSECKAMKKLAKTAALANNQTAMDAFVAKKKLNDTQVTKFKDQISKAQTKLQELQSNTTLTDLCASQKSQKGSDSGSSTTGAAAESSSSTPKASTGAASSLTLQTVPYFFVPALAGVFAVLL